MREITVVGGSGEVWTGAAAWVTVLWALRTYRKLAFRLGTPAGMPLARAAVLAAARIRTVTRQEPEPALRALPADDPFHEGWTVVACDEQCEIEH